VISQYDYIYDAAGRRISCAKSGSAFTQDDTVAYGYNNRSELTNAVAAVDSNYRYTYDFDDIGNRKTSSERGTNSVYAANQLNQYTEISDSALSASPCETFTPQFDDDGNQTLVKTATGIWSVTYNGENRPILWTLVNSSTPNSSTPPLISMSYDRMGRRVTKNNQRFVYDGYLQIANSELQTPNSKLQTFIWDPAEPIATRPLVWGRSDFSVYYTHDGNKNVSDMMLDDASIASHYEYAPFGEFSIQLEYLISKNFWSFSGEFFDKVLGVMSYNHRHYNPMMGRWLHRDGIEELGGVNLYLYTHNCPLNSYDLLGMFDLPAACPKDIDSRKKYSFEFLIKNSKTYIIYDYRTERQVRTQISVNGCSIPRWLKWLPAAKVFNNLFNGACNNHDICYGTCNKNKEGCDDRFYEEMIASCSAYSNDVGDKAYCKTMAYVFYLAVSKGGSSFYEAAQDEYCEHDKCSQCWSGE
jgi:RHS repeat-associated protein